MSAPRPFHVKLLAALFCLALAARLAVWLPGALHGGGQAFLRPDSHTYMGPARALAAGQGYVREPGSAEPETAVTPGFPAFLAAVARVLGPGPATAPLVLCLVGALAVIPIYLAARLLAGGGAAVP